MRTTKAHDKNGPFVQGLPTEQGWYWFIRTLDCPVGPEPCKVLLGEGDHVRSGVLSWGWDPGKIMSLTDKFVVEGFYAPMAPPATV